MKWEYNRMLVTSDKWANPLDDEFIYEYINEQGEDGWELVAVDSGIAYFKRPKENYGKEEKEAALKEEENKEDEGEPKRTAQCPSICPICFSSFKCPLGYSS
jgi:hypothetical protein